MSHSYRAIQPRRERNSMPIILLVGLGVVSLILLGVYLSNAQGPDMQLADGIAPLAAATSRTESRPPAANAQTEGRAPAANVAVKPPSPTSGQDRVVQKFEGSNEGKTSKFFIASKQWRVTWQSSLRPETASGPADNRSGMFELDLCTDSDAGGRALVMKRLSSDSRGLTGPGWFYFHVLGQCDWQLTVTETLD